MSVPSENVIRRGNPLRPYIWGLAGALLLLPAVAMQFTHEVNWTAFDFVFASIMLLAACGAYELGAWLSGNIAYRAAFGIAILTGFMTVWVNGAVGMVGDEGNPVNLMFLGVVLVGIVTSLLTKFDAGKMAGAMLLTGGAQGLATAVAAFSGAHPLEIVLIACFAGPWLLAAQLFRKAAQDALAGAAR